MLLVAIKLVPRVRSAMGRILKRNKNYCLCYLDHLEWYHFWSFFLSDHDRLFSIPGRIQDVRLRGQHTLIKIARALYTRWKKHERAF